MRIGLLAWGSSTGLGHQTKELYEHLKPVKTLLSDLSALNKMPVHHDWYPDARVDKANENSYLTDDSIWWLTEGVDVIIFCETPLSYRLLAMAKEKGIAVVQQPNYEFFDYFRNPNLPRPTLIGMPTIWGTPQIKLLGFNDVVSLPVPIDRKALPFRRINECKTFVHTIGRPAVHDRNGTLQFLEAAKKVGNDFKYVVTYQPPSDPRAMQYFEPVKNAIENAKNFIDLTIYTDLPNYSDLYDLGDVLVLPRKYGGLCLPMQEALSCGLPVIMSGIAPNYDRLPHEWLCQSQFETQFYAHTTIDIYQAEVGDLANKMLQFKDNRFMQEANLKANDIAETLSWTNMLDYYKNVLDQAICLVKK